MLFIILIKLFSSEILTIGDGHSRVTRGVYRGLLDVGVATLLRMTPQSLFIFEARKSWKGIPCLFLNEICEN